MFTYFYSACVFPETILEIADLGIKTVNWYCNASYQFHLVSEIAPAYSLCMVPERDRLDHYRNVGARPLYIQEAANPTYYSPPPAPEADFASFVGQRYGERPALALRLFTAGVPIRVFGPGWVRRPRLRDFVNTALGRAQSTDVELPGALCRAPVPDADLPALFARSLFTLGFNAVAPRPGADRITQIRLRDFEAPMSGAAYLVEHSDEYAEFFEPDVEVAMYRSVDEMVEKAVRLSRDAAWRKKLRHNGRARCLREHTWAHRFTDVFRALELQD